MAFFTEVEAPCSSRKDGALGFFLKTDAKAIDVVSRTYSNGVATSPALATVPIVEYGAPPSLDVVFDDSPGAFGGLVTVTESHACRAQRRPYECLAKSVVLIPRKTAKVHPMQLDISASALFAHRC